MHAKPVPICKHCGRWKLNHEQFNLPPSESETIKEGYTLSLTECLQGFGFESENAPSSFDD